jgi:hypothetical protein
MSGQMSNSDRSFARRQRDAALERLRSTRRWLIVAAAALTAAFAALVSAVAPGKTLAAKRVSGLSAGSSGRLPPLASPSSLGLGGGGGSDQPPQPPATAPSAPEPSAPAPAPPSAGPAPSGGGGGVVSGGS